MSAERLTLYGQRNDFPTIGSGTEPAGPTPAEGSPAVGLNDGPRVKDERVAALERSKEMARDPELLERPILGGRFTVGLSMMRFTGHDADHLVQAVSIRRILGAWPPPGGGRPG